MTSRPDWPTPTAGIERQDGFSSTDDCSRDCPFAHLLACHRLVAAGVSGDRFRCRRSPRIDPTRMLVAPGCARPVCRVPGFLDPAGPGGCREELSRVVPAVSASGAVQ